MSETRKNISSDKSRTSKIHCNNAVITTKTIVPAENTLFPEKLKRVNEMLGKAKPMNK